MAVADERALAQVRFAKPDAKIFIARLAMAPNLLHDSMQRVLPLEEAR